MLKIVYGFKFQTDMLKRVLFDPDSDEKITLWEHLRDKAQAPYFVDEIGIFPAGDDVIIGAFEDIESFPYCLPSEHGKRSFEEMVYKFFVGCDVVRDSSKYHEFLVEEGV